MSQKITRSRVGDIHLYGSRLLYLQDQASRQSLMFLIKGNGLYIQRALDLFPMYQSVKSRRSNSVLIRVYMLSHSEPSGTTSYGLLNRIYPTTYVALSLTENKRL